MRVGVARAGFVLALIALSACGLSRNVPRPNDGPAGVGAASDPLEEEGPTLKLVAGKRSPNILVAKDRTTCRVSRERYMEVEVGTEQYCDWSRPKRQVSRPRT
ncbi:MAG TPA: hypothetical protein VFB46_13400 [Gemmatimonadaceae bacterium]|nr:hypothetical protein [Gemmatimonadaceae bacterium]